MPSLGTSHIMRVRDPLSISVKIFLGKFVGDHVRGTASPPSGGKNILKVFSYAQDAPQDALCVKIMVFILVDNRNEAAGVYHIVRRVQNPASVQNIACFSVF